MCQVLLFKLSRHLCKGSITDIVGGVVASGLGSSPGRRHFSLTVTLRLQPGVEMGTGEFNAGG